jgi:hypothetical protein
MPKKGKLRGVRVLFVVLQSYYGKGENHTFLAHCLIDSVAEFHRSDHLW